MATGSERDSGKTVKRIINGQEKELRRVTAWLPKTSPAGRSRFGDNLTNEQWVNRECTWMRRRGLDAHVISNKSNQLAIARGDWEPVEEVPHYSIVKE